MSLLPPAPEGSFASDNAAGVSPEVMDALAQNDMQAPLPLRQKTAAATFRQTSTYDDAIAAYLADA